MPFYTNVTLNLFQVKKEKERETASQKHTCPIKKLKHQILMRSKQKLKQLIHRGYSNAHSICRKA